MTELFREAVEIYLQRPGGQECHRPRPAHLGTAGREGDATCSCRVTIWQHAGHSPALCSCRIPTWEHVRHSEALAGAAGQGSRPSIGPGAPAWHRDPALAATQVKNPASAHVPRMRRLDPVIGCDESRVPRWLADTRRFRQPFGPGTRIQQAGSSAGTVSLRSGKTPTGAASSYHGLSSVFADAVASCRASRRIATATGSPSPKLSNRPRTRCQAPRTRVATGPARPGASPLAGFVPPAP